MDCFHPLAACIAPFRIIKASPYEGWFEPYPTQIHLVLCLKDMLSSATETYLQPLKGSQGQWE